MLKTLQQNACAGRRDRKHLFNFNYHFRIILANVFKVVTIFWHLAVNAGSRKSNHYWMEALTPLVNQKTNLAKAQLRLSCILKERLNCLIEKQEEIFPVFQKKPPGSNYLK